MRAPLDWAVKLGGVCAAGRTVGGHGCAKGVHKAGDNCLRIVLVWFHWAAESRLSDL
jgi:hypothetical protein